jgi:hypothetical protein
MDVCCYRFVICRCRNSSHLMVCIIEVPLYPIPYTLYMGLVRSVFRCWAKQCTIMCTASRSILLCWFVDLCMLITRYAV